MTELLSAAGLETKFCRPDAGGAGGLAVEGAVISGYASLFGIPDQGGDVVQKGAYAASLKALAEQGRAVRMLWQHDPAQPIGVWDEIREDDRGLFVKGRLLEGVARAEEARRLVAAGAIDGLSIGYRTRRAQRDSGGRRLLQEVELWEVSLVTFPMLPQARVAGKADRPEAQDLLHEVAAALVAARDGLARWRESISSTQSRGC